MSNKGPQKNNNIAVTIFSVVGGAILLFVGYCFWVNSHFFESNFFGLTIQLPLESREHFCHRKADFGLTYDSGTYYNCLQEGDSLHSRLIKKIKSESTYSADETFKKYGISKDKFIECVAKITEKYYSSSEIEQYIKTGKKMQLKDGMTKESYSKELQDCYYK